MSYERGDVVWCRDPFKADPDAGRPWLVVNNETHPFRDKQVMALAVSTSGYDEAVPTEDHHWIDGGTPRQSYVFPWSVHSPQDRFIEFRQETLVEPLVGRAISDLLEYVE